ncbi:MAG: aminotransferase class I/II-fold pyridoxal phosphate-dependent enzyme [Stellaceae bacterium]
MTDIMAMAAQLSPEEKHDLTEWLLRQREANGAEGAVAMLPAPPTDVNGDLPKSSYRFDHHPVYRYLRRFAEMLPPEERDGVTELYFRMHDGIARDTVSIAGREYITFSHYNYLGLSGHPDVTAAVTRAVERYGTSVSGSRMVGGERPLHRELERELASMYGTPDCLVFVSGYGTNVATISHLFGPNDLILHDELIHNSVIVGARLSRARRIAFPHNDWQAVDRLLRQRRRDYARVLIVVEGIYSMDGDYPDLPAFIELRNRHKVFLMVDEAHSVGVMGKRGFGIREHFGLKGEDVDIWMGTLSKALASCGGYITGSEALMFSLRYGAAGFMFSVGQSPADAAAAVAALHVMQAEPERVERLRARGRLFLEIARQHGLPTGSAQGYSIVPVIVGDSMRCIRLTQALFRRGIHVQPILHPAVDEHEARLRLFLTCMHTDEQIRHAVGVIAEELRAVRER